MDFDTVAISGLTRAARPDAEKPAGAGDAEAPLRETCRDFEGVFMSTLLKQCMKPMFLDEEEQAVGNDQLFDYALEQAGREIGRAGSFGIADTLLSQLALQAARKTEAGQEDTP
ncbi:MAG: hypothetical protein JXR37_37880 [Kiritimatiellae bacterium]|nr:hypothetical protein [Kiritimatiellia bacterium]